MSIEEDLDREVLDSLFHLKEHDNVTPTAAEVGRHLAAKEGISLEGSGYSRMVEKSLRRLYTKRLVYIVPYRGKYRYFLLVDRDMHVLLEEPRSEDIPPVSTDERLGYLSRKEDRFSEGVPIENRELPGGD